MDFELVEMKNLVALFRKKNMYIGSCESFTAGLFSTCLASISGASNVLKGGFVTYATSLKQEIVHVSKEVIETYGVISEECAKEMAEKARLLLDVDVCVSFTGNAGPDAMEQKPAGYVCFAIADQDGTDTFSMQWDLSRNVLRLEAVKLMCNKLLEKYQD